MSFNWRDYIDLDRTLGSHTKDVALALDRIGTTPEGKELIQKAFNLSRDRHDTEEYRPFKKVIIGSKFPPIQEIFALGDNTETNTLEGFIKLHFPDIIHSYYKIPHGDQPMGLIGTMVHELYHLADPKTDITATVEQEEQFEHTAEAYVFRSPKLTEFQLEGLHLDLDMVYGEATKELTSFEDFPKLTQYLHDHPEVKTRIAKFAAVSPDSFSIRPITNKDIMALKVKYIPGTDPKTGMPKSEEAATHYTDAFMAKYFSIPPRVHYGNSETLGNAYAAVPESFHCTTKPLPKYHFETVLSSEGMYAQQPRMLPNSCHSVLAKLDTGLRK